VIAGLWLLVGIYVGGVYTGLLLALGLDYLEARRIRAIRKE
jgi:hypothetical protein